MWKYALSILILLSWGKIAHSQADYPKRVVINSDTVIAITPEQRDSIMSAFIDLDACGEELVVYKNIVTLLDEERGLIDSLINSYERERLHNFETLRLNHNLQKSYQKELKRKNRQLFAYKIGGGLVISAAAVTIILLSVK